jgi:hypothetical protein
MCPNSEYEVPDMSAAVATEYVRRMVQQESRGPGDTSSAMARIEQKFGIGYWTFDHLRKGDAKTCDVTLFARIRAAYVAMCERQITRLQHEIQMAKASGDDDLDSLEAEALALAQKIAARKKEAVK